VVRQSGRGSLHGVRDAIENAWSQPLAYEEHSHAAMANAREVGAAGLPFPVFRGYVGVDLPKVNIVEFKKKAVARWNIADPAAALRDLEERERGISMSLPAPSSPLNMRHGD